MIRRTLAKLPDPPGACSVRRAGGHLPALAQAKESKDFQRLFALQAALADGVLWDIERVARWRACLESDLAAYQE